MSRALVVGLGRSGRGAAALLARRGWEVVAVDAGAPSVSGLADLGVDVRLGGDAPVPGVDLVVKSPGVPGEVQPVAAARAAGAEVISEVELAARLLPNPLVGITGTNGKTTTTELTAHLLRVTGRKAVACGNQGLPMTDLVDAVDPEAWLVVECSSFQLEDVHRFHPRAAVLLNITPDHLDRHGSMEAYRAAKLRLFANLAPGDLAIAPADIAIPGAAPRRTVDEGPRGPASVAWSQGGLHVDGLGRVCAWEEVSLRGRHNRQNAMAAAAVAAAAGADAAQIAWGLAGFPGVAHRLERVGTRDGVTWVNDSKATNPDAAVAALDAYPAGVHLIAGGRGKGTPFDAFAAAARPAVVRAYLIGETADEIGAAMAAAGVPHTACGDLERAVRAAAAAARPGETVLLAPACASFDQFAGYEARGEAFRALARELGAR
ncbi:MAG TPA: UDP-N-acetylmuramoyl-L-alanine--D-glutamate ligase [Miltoncostaeaceae bacterium]|nr:UDP-N-acetylmuramoyl-L-alanine--D-glutamate ligase [Miltoncostaeaceae bacterium]